jgi:hypothetical protein
MLSYLSKRIEIPWLKPRAVLIWLAWVALTFIALFLAGGQLRGLYPNWDEQAGRIFSLFICGALILAWSIWILWLLFGRRRQLYSWFRVGVCFALFLGIVRDFFMAEVVKLLGL